MNLLQLGRKALFEIDAIRTGNVASDLWSLEEVYDAVNTAMDRAARIIRLADSDILTRRLVTTGGALDLISESYAQSSLRLLADTSSYTLPPDFVRLVSIVPTTAGFEAVRFRPAQLNAKYFVDQRVLTSDDLASSNNSDQVFWYIIYGGRTLLVSPTPQDTINLEVFYQYRPSRLLTYSTSTVSLTNNNAAVTGSSTTWLTSGIRTPCDLVVGTAPTALNVSLNTYSPRVLSIDTNTTLTLARVYSGATDGTAGYALAMIPELPEEHHEWLAQTAAAIMYRKVNAETSGKLMEALDSELRLAVQPELTIRQQQESLAVEPFEIPG